MALVGFTKVINNLFESARLAGIITRCTWINARDIQLDETLMSHEFLNHFKEKGIFPARVFDCLETGSVDTITVPYSTSATVTRVM